MKFWRKEIRDYEERPKEFFVDRRRNSGFVLLAIIAATAFAGWLIQFNFPLIFQRFSAAIGRFFQLYMPANFTEMPYLIEGIWDTFVLSVSSATIGSILAYLAALSMSKKTSKGPAGRIVLRFIVTFIRNVPTSIWAIILLMAFWFGEFLALLVMTLGTFGFNARLFSDIIDESSSTSIEALNAVGASRWQIIMQSIIPDTLPAIISWSLYAIETNIRSATIIGMLAGGGIGHLIGIYRNFRRFDELTAAVLFIVVLVLIFDRLSQYVRKRLLA